jgi:hypothetical protein
MLQSQPQREDPIKKIGGIAITCDSPESNAMLESPNTRDLLRR